MEPKTSFYRADEGNDWEMDLKANRQVTDTGPRDTEWPKWEFEWSKVDRGPPSTQSLRSLSHHQFMEGLSPGPQDVDGCHVSVTLRVLLKVVHCSEWEFAS